MEWSTVYIVTNLGAADRLGAYRFGVLRMMMALGKLAGIA